MDAWKQTELKKMLAGGNAKFLAFFKKYGVAKETPVTEKYNTKVAEIYREVVSAAAEGRKYTPPSPSEVQSQSSSSFSGTPSRAGGMRKGGGGGGMRTPAKSSGGGGGGLDSWGDWGTSKGSSTSKGNNNSTTTQHFGNYSSGGNSNGNSSVGGWGGNYQNSSADNGGVAKKQMWGVGSAGSISADQYQGGGGGGDGGGQFQVDDLSKMMNTGWNKLNSMANNVKQSETGEKLMLQAQFGLVKGKELGTKGWNSLVNFTKNAVSTIKDNLAEEPGQRGNSYGGYDSNGGGGYQSSSGGGGGGNDFFGGFDNNGGHSGVQSSNYSGGFSNSNQSNAKPSYGGQPSSPRSPRKSFGKPKAKVEDDNWGTW